NDQRLSAPRIFINVGGRARVPDLQGVRDVPFLDNSSMMNLNVLPRHLIVIGGSYIGLEFGQMFRRFGSEVTIVEIASRLIAREDDDVTAAIHEIVTNEGIEVRLNAECMRLSREGDDVCAGVNCSEGTPEVRGSHLLLATGRRPNTDDLGLENAGVTTDKHG